MKRISVNDDVLVKVGEDYMPGIVIAVGTKRCRVVYTDDYGYDEVDVFCYDDVNKR